MNKNKLSIIFIMLLVVLVFIGYSMKSGAVKLSLKPKVIVENNVSTSDNKGEANKLESELENETIEVSSENKEGEINEINVTQKQPQEEVSQADVSQAEVSQEVQEHHQEEMKEEPKEDWHNWKPGVSSIKMLLPDVNSEPRVKINTHVVIHFASNAYNNPNDPYNINDTYSIFEQYEVSSHYVIDRTGQIYLFVPEIRVAYHAGKGKLSDYPEYENRLNQYSIGIELLAIGTREEMIPVITAEKFNLINPNLIGFTEDQYKALNTLLGDILSRNPTIKRDRKHIIGHDEYNPVIKTDPGSLFDWSRIGF
ncbi:N-acetylmuramoyl-L-alanine amidase [Clostridium gasigenes]|nr:N-acetylmuramoyl-L-alanine amidase [Clostridium gasigenes]